MKEIGTGVVLIIVSWLFMGCTAKNNAYYPKESVKLQNVITDPEWITIYYTIPLETVYYSPGIDYEYGEDDKQFEISVVRQKLKASTTVMAESKLLKNTKDSVLVKDYGINTYVVKIPNDVHLENKDNDRNSIKVSD